MKNKTPVYPKGFSLYKKHLKLSDEEAKFLSDYITKEDIKATQLVRRLLREWMDKEQGTKPKLNEKAKKSSNRH